MAEDLDQQLEAFLASTFAPWAETRESAAAGGPGDSAGGASVAPAPYYPQTVTVDGRPSVGPVDWDSLGGYAGAALHPVGQRQGLAKPSIAPALHYPQTTTVDGRPSVGSVDWASPGGYTGAPLQSTDQTYGLAGPSVAPAQPFPQTATAGGRLADVVATRARVLAQQLRRRGYQ